MVFDNVTFRYEEGAQDVLCDLNLTAKAGQRIALVGPSGGGKTTLCGLIPRFYEVSGGKITIDGVDVRDVTLDSLRQNIGVVQQDVYLFAGTVMENIRYGRPDASEKEIIAAAKEANAHDFITRLPDGYATQLTANGANLSQGQRQLLAIARAAVADPPVMILDEATSSIDTHTEAIVQRGMDKLMEGKTVFVIAHRLSTVRNANAIMVLENGEIIEKGDHDELLRQEGKYYKLYTGQFELSYKTNSYVEIGDSIELLAEYVGEGSSSLTWTSSDEAIAIVDDSGVVTGVKAGTVTIKVALADNAEEYAEFTVTVHSEYNVEFG